MGKLDLMGWDTPDSESVIFNNSRLWTLLSDKKVDYSYQ